MWYINSTTEHKLALAPGFETEEQAKAYLFNPKTHWLHPLETYMVGRCWRRVEQPEYEPIAPPG